MALKRYIGPHDSVTVSVAGNDFGMVEHGSSLAVPDELAESVAWPEDHWEDVTEEPMKERDNTGEGDA